MHEHLKLEAEGIRMARRMTAFTTREEKLRSKVIESILVLYSITGDESLREQAWTICPAIVKQTRTNYEFPNVGRRHKGCFTEADNVGNYPVAGAMKNFSPISSAPNVLSRVVWVFSTEGRPSPRLDHERP